MPMATCCTPLPWSGATVGVQTVGQSAGVQLACSVVAPAAVQQKQARVAAPSAKKNEAERDYSVEQLRSWVVALLEKKSGGARKIAAADGFPKAARSIERYRDQVVAAVPPSDSAAATLAARVAHAQRMEFKVKGNVDLTSRRLFSDDELDYFARTLKLYSDMGWPMDYQAIRLMFSQAAAEMQRVDWKRGDAYVVSRTYVRNFLPGMYVNVCRTEGGRDIWEGGRANIMTNSAAKRAKGFEPGESSGRVRD